MNNFRPPNTGIKPYNPLTEERQMYELKKMTAPGAGPLTMPKPIQAPMQMHTAPGAFEKLRKILSGGR